jgi:hypothetical protein
MNSPILNTHSESDSESEFVLGIPNQNPESSYASPRFFSFAR